VIDPPETEYHDAANLAAYHEMHFAEFVTSYDPGCPTITGESTWPGSLVAELQRGTALTECFYTQICEVLDEAGPISGSLALDIACATGRMSAELAARGARVLAVDLSEQFVNEARRIILDSAGRPELTFAQFKSGSQSVYAELPWKLGPEDVMFAVADATRLPLDDDAAQLVLVLNLIDRVEDPVAILAEAWRCVAPGGYLLHADPFDYRETSTPDETKRIKDLDLLFREMGGEVVSKRNVAFPVRRAWSQNVQCYIDEVALYRRG
jgi:SAM-dependent methyltransferase